MRVFIQSDSRHCPADRDFFIAMQGFKELGAEIQFFHTPEEMNRANPPDIIVGYVGTVRRRLQHLGLPVPELDYPLELQSFLGRKVWQSTINTINSHPEQWPVFVKSIADKEITGVLVHSPKDLIGCGNWAKDTPVWCATPVNFVSEWRCFVRYGRILDVRQYKGRWEDAPDTDIIKSAIAKYTTAPAGYAADFGLTQDGKTLLIEINDGYALGSYGLFYIDYAKLLAARWAELTQTEDEYSYF